MAGFHLAEPATTQAVRLKWDALPGAVGHRLYRNLFPVGSELAFGVPIAEYYTNETLYYEDRLDQAGFFFPQAKAAGMKTNLRNMWSRMPLTRADVQMLHGVLRQMVRWTERG